MTGATAGGAPPSSRLEWLSIAVLAAGVGFTIHLQTTIREGVFTQGDLAMKYLLTRQLAQTGFAPDLRLPAETWVKDLWSRGLHPFPFAVRRHGEREYLFYPVTFPLVSAPLYGAFGFRGLYVIPLVSTWAIWLAFLALAERYGMREPWRAAMLAVLIFATPLTFYSATFWEHTLAVALAFPPLALALAPRGPRTFRAAASFGMGAMMGVGAWFREEILFLAGIAAAFVALPPRWRRLDPLSVRRWAFVTGVLATIALFLAANVTLYGRPLGLHGDDFLGWLSDWSRSASAARFLVASLADHYAIGGGLLVVLAALWWRGEYARIARPAAILLLSVAFCVAVPLLARHEGGRQFGPRFLLVVFPLSALAGGLLLQVAFNRLSPLARWGMLLPLGALAVVGVNANTAEGARHLRVNYQRRQLSYNAVRNSEPRVIAVSHEFVAQALADLVGERVFFLTPQAQKMKLLVRELRRRGESRLLYLCYPQYPCGPFSALPPELALSSGQGPLVRFEKVGRFDRYVMYQGSVLSGKADEEKAPRKAAVGPAEDTGR